MARKIANPNTHRFWRQAVLARDGFKCVECSGTEKLEADHIQPYSKFPELRYDVSNGRTLCNSCHKKTPTYGGKQLKGTRRCRDLYNPNCWCCRKDG